MRPSRPQRRASAATPAAGGLPFWIAAAAIAVLAVVSHSPLRHSQYIQDDLLAVKENVIAERGRLGEIFSTSYWEGARGVDRTLYRPLVILSYAAERRLTGEPDARVSQAINVALHAGASIVLLLLVRRTGLSPFSAWAAAALFAVHPVHVEAVANIVGRAEILAALFTFLALYASSHAGAWNGPARPAVARLAAWSAAVCLFAALASKETAVAAPLLLVALELYLRPRPVAWNLQAWIDRLGALAPSALALLLYGVLRVQALELGLGLQRPHPLDNPLIELEGVTQLATSLGLLARYAGLLLVPWRLVADYSGGSIRIEPDLSGPLPLVGLALLAGLLLLAVLGIRRAPIESVRNRAAFGGLLFLLPYLVIGNLLFPVGSIFAERFLYLPSAGFCLLVGLALGRMLRGFPGLQFESTRRRRWTVRVALALLLAAFSLRTWSRCLDWRNMETLFRSAVAVQPDSPRAHFILGKVELEHGDARTALRSLERTLELYPEHAGAWLDRGRAFGLLGRYDRAEAMFREALRVSPGYAGAHLNLAIAIRRQGRTAEAEVSLEKARLWGPGRSDVLAEMGNLHLATGRYASAVELYERARARGHRGLEERLRRARELARGGSE